MSIYILHIIRFDLGQAGADLTCVRFDLLPIGDDLTCVRFDLLPISNGRKSLWLGSMFKNTTFKLKAT